MNQWEADNTKKQIKVKWVRQKSKKGIRELRNVNVNLWSESVMRKKGTSLISLGMKCEGFVFVVLFATQKHVIFGLYEISLSSYYFLLLHYQTSLPFYTHSIFIYYRYLVIYALLNNIMLVCLCMCFNFTCGIRL